MFQHHVHTPPANLLRDTGIDQTPPSYQALYVLTVRVRTANKPFEGHRHCADSSSVRLPLLLPLPRISPSPLACLIKHEKQHRGKKKATQVAKRKTEVTKRNTEVTKTNTKVTKRNTMTEVTKRNKVTKRNTDVTKSNTKVTKTNTEVTKRNTEVTKRNTDVTKRNTEVTEPNTDVTKRNTEVTERNTEVTKRNMYICNDGLARKYGYKTSQLVFPIYSTSLTKYITAIDLLIRLSPLHSLKILMVRRASGLHSH